MIEVSGGISEEERGERRRRKGGDIDDDGDGNSKKTSSRMRLAAATRHKMPMSGGLSWPLSRPLCSVATYLGQKPYPRDERAVEDVGSSRSAGDILVSSHCFFFLLARRNKAREKMKNSLTHFLGVCSCSLDSFLRGISFSRKRGYFILREKKEHEAPRAAAAIAAGPVARRRRRQLVCRRRRSSSCRRLDDIRGGDIAPRGKRPRCSSSRGDQVRALYFSSLNTRHMRLCISLSPSHFIVAGKLLHVLLRRQGEGTEGSDDEESR